MDHSSILVNKFVCEYCLLEDLTSFLLLIVVNISTSSDC